MSSSNYADDPQGFVDELPKKAKFESADDGNEYYVPGDEELAELNTFMLQEIQEAERNHAGFYERLARNERAYEALPASGSDKQMIVLPIIRRDCDQISAWFVNTIMRPHPIFSFDPCFPANYELPAPNDDINFPVGIIDATAEQVANSLEHSMEYILRERLNFRRLVETVIGEIVKGRGPAIVKVVYDRTFHEQMITKFEKGTFDIGVFTGPKKVRKEEGEPVKAYAIPAENFLMPANEEDPLTSRWVSERTPLTTPNFKRELKKKHSLIKSAEWEAALGATGESQQAAKLEMKGTVDGRLSLTPVNQHDVREVWFEHYEADADTPTKFLGLFHVQVGKFVWITRNPYNHKRNPYVAIFQKKRAFRFSGSSTAEELEPIQKLASTIIHLMLGNAIVANGVVFRANPDSEAFDWIQENEIETGDLIPGMEGDVEAINLGREHRGLMQELGFLLDLGRSVSGQNQYKSGEVIPGRTSPNTVSQILEQGQQVPLAQLMGIADSLCDVVWLWLKTYKQYKPLGEILYVMDPEEKELVDIPFRLPDEEALDNFKITLTAADELAAQEASDEMITMLANLLDQDADKVAAIIGPLVDLNMPDSLVPILKRLIERKQDLIELLLDRSRVDSKRFIVSKEMLMTVEQERMMLKLRQERMMAAQPAAGAPQGGPPGAAPVQPAGMAG